MAGKEPALGARCGPGRGKARWMGQEAASRAA